MRPVNLTPKAATLAVLSLFAATACAFTAAVPDGASPPSNAASAAAPAKPLTSAAVQAVAIGKASTVTAAQGKKPAMGTIAELEDLQRQTALAEARKRLRDLTQSGPDGKEGAVATPTPGPTLAPTPGPTPAPQSLANQAPQNTHPVSIIPDSQLPKALRAKLKKASTNPAPPAIATPAPEVIQMDPVVGEPPKAKLVNLFVVGGRARADVLDGGRMLTIKEGDLLSKWTVSSITASGVTVEYRYMVDVPVAATTPPITDGVRPAIAQAFPAAYALANSQRSSETQERVKSVKLDSATAQEIAIASGVAPAMSGPLPPPIQQGAPLPMGAGANGMADSASIPPVPPVPPVPPLPTALAGPSGGMPMKQR